MVPPPVGGTSATLCAANAFIPPPCSQDGPASSYFPLAEFLRFSVLIRRRNFDLIDSFLNQWTKGKGQWSVGTGEPPQCLGGRLGWGGVKRSRKREGRVKQEKKGRRKNREEEEREEEEGGGGAVAEEQEQEGDGEEKAPGWHGAPAPPGAAQPPVSQGWTPAGKGEGRVAAWGARLGASGSLRRGWRGPEGTLLPRVAGSWDGHPCLSGQDLRGRRCLAEGHLWRFWYQGGGRGMLPSELRGVWGGSSVRWAGNDCEWIVVSGGACVGCAFVSSSGAGLWGSGAACPSVRVGVRGLLSRAERADGLRGYLLPAGSGYVLGASYPILSGVGGGTLGRQVGWSSLGPLSSSAHLSCNKFLLLGWLAWGSQWLMLFWASSEFWAKDGADANMVNKWSTLAFLARWLVQISAAAGISKLLMGALPLVPSWVGCSGGNHPPSLLCIWQGFTVLFSLSLQKGLHTQTHTEQDDRIYIV